MTQEAFKPVPEFPDYEVGNGGTIRRVTAAKGTTVGPIKATPNKGGYFTVSLRSQGKTHTKYVHDIVGKTFIKGFKPGLSVNHVDRNRSNNALKNLEFTVLEDNKGHGRLTKARVFQIKNLLRKKFTVAQIAVGLKLRIGVVQIVAKNKQ